MTRQTKFIKGARIATPAEAITAIEAGRWLYLHDKPMHPGFLAGMPVRTVAGFAKDGCLYYAALRVEGPCQASIADWASGSPR